MLASRQFINTNMTIKDPNDCNFLAGFNVAVAAIAAAFPAAAFCVDFDVADVRFMLV